MGNDLTKVTNDLQRPYWEMYKDVILKDPEFPQEEQFIKNPELTYAVDNKEFVRPKNATNNTIWTAVAVIPTSNERVSIGSSGNAKYRQAGILSIILAVPQGTSTGRLLKVCEQIRLRYLGRRIGSTIMGRVQVFVDGRDNIEEKDAKLKWFYGRVQAEFTYDYRN